MTRGPVSNAATQREQILALMCRRQGTASPWVGWRDFPGIRNITPRVSELRGDHLIVTDRAEDGTARYRLAQDLDDVPAEQLVADVRAAVRAAERGAEPSGQAALFEVAPPRASYRDVDAAPA